MVKQATVKDVAKLAGVSQSTVSLVINKSPKVSPKTQKKVQEAIDALKYVPNNFAVSLRQGQRECYGVLVPDVSNPYYIEIIQGLRDRCADKINLQISETRYDIDKEEKEIEFLKGIRTSGYVFIGTVADDQLVADISSNRIVFIDKMDKSGQIPSVLIDNRKSSCQATEYLIEKGCRNLYYLGQPQRQPTEPLEQRYQGFRDALLAHGMNPEGRVILSLESFLNKMESGYMQMKGILQHTVPDGIVTSSDLIALGAIRGILDMGYTVPDDISVIGFDNIDFAKYSNPRLTTINQSCHKMGEIAFDLLASNPVGRNKMNNIIILDSDFIIRDSVKK